MSLDRFLAVDFSVESMEQYSQYLQNSSGQGGLQNNEDIENIVPRVGSENPGAVSAVPVHVREMLGLGGYEQELAEWTPPACRLFLEYLQKEWPGFSVRGWHGCRYPEEWPPDMCVAVQTVYVVSIQ